MLCNHYLDHAHPLKTNQNFRQTIDLFLVTPKGIVNLLHNHQKTKLKFDPTAVYLHCCQGFRIWHDKKFHEKRPYMM